MGEHILQKFKITTMLKPGILDNAGKAVTQALNRLGFDYVTNVRIGKTFYVEYDGDIKEIAKSLTNEVMETYEVEKMKYGKKI